MPPTPFLGSLLLDHVSRDTTSGSVPDDGALQVVCAWPVSGQYGPGSRVLYYVLVAICVLARKQVWLRNACLPPALLFPAVAALHGIVLAAAHVEGAVDMDVYGAFQLCAIGILAAPVTAIKSKTYFFDPGRNTIFLWTVLLLAGLLSLTVEFFRINESDCKHDGSGNPISRDPSKFPYGEDGLCGLRCSVEAGPFSPLRDGSANNIYVIPVPHNLAFGAATLLAAACCIPAILLLISMWNKIVETNWKARFGKRYKDEGADEPIPGTNGATIGKMKSVNDMIRWFLSVVEIPLFGGAVLALLVVGERNLFSKQVMYQTEPIASIGQWAPIVGAGLATLGSLYLLLVKDMDAVIEETDPKTRHCNCYSHSHHHRHGHDRCSVTQSRFDADDSAMGHNSSELPEQGPAGLTAMQDNGNAIFRPSTTHSADCPIDMTHIAARSSNESSKPTSEHQLERCRTPDVGNRRKVAEVLTAAARYLGSPPPDWHHDPDFKQGKAGEYPEVPGEPQRNRDLSRTRERYDPPRHADGNVTPRLSRVSSFTGSIASDIDVGNERGRRHTSTMPPPGRTSSSASRSQNPTSSSRTQHTRNPSQERTSSDSQQNCASPVPAGPSGRVTRPRGNTLEVPQLAYHCPIRHDSNNSSDFPITCTEPVAQGPNAPAIMISPNSEPASPEPAPDSRPPVDLSPAEPSQLPPPTMELPPNS